MRICVVGGGTAGYMAVAHLNRRHPRFSVAHLFDDRNATIGVGEGSTPSLIQWLHSLGLGFEDLEANCEATRKTGIQFQEWGKSDRFSHSFFPLDRSAAHFSARGFPDLLAGVSYCQRINENLASLERGPDGVTITTDRKGVYRFDFVVFATGFPDPQTSPLTHFSWIPTNCAIVGRCPVQSGLEETVSKALRSGWMFQIPLQTDVGCGYVFDAGTSDVNAMFADFECEVKRSFGRAPESSRLIKFPNFLHNSPADGYTFCIGNAASFIEPLEATAIGVTVFQLELLSLLLSNIEENDLRRGKASHNLIGWINDKHRSIILRLSIFVGWHYSLGSNYETEFWRAAKERFIDSSRIRELRPVWDDFDEVLRSSRLINPEALQKIWSGTAELNSILGAMATRSDNFGGFDEVNFAQMALGLEGKMVISRGVV